jgi:hypothetical protein
MKISPMVAEFPIRTDAWKDGRTDGHTDRRKEASSRFSQFYERSRKPLSYSLEADTSPAASHKAEMTMHERGLPSILHLWET